VSPGALPVALDRPRAATLDAHVATKKLPDCVIESAQETMTKEFDDGG
jgi:hypothetical protein